MYYILEKHYYYSGTFNAPTNQPLKGNTGKKLLFSTIDEAINYLLSIDNTMYAITAQTYTTEGYYCLNHGEYDRPDYQIRKIRK